MTSRKVCLIIEDDEDISGLLSFILDRDGFEVHAVETGAAGLHAAAEFAPSLITLDLGLPDMDGRDLARRLRTLSTAPILIITAFAGTGEELESIAAGATAYLTKPFRPTELSSIVGKLCQTANQTSEHPRPSTGMR